MCEISSEQQIILNREDAWIPSQPGRSFPGANIPIKVLNRLNSFTERQANGRHLSVADDSEQNGEPPEAQKSPSVSTAFDKHQSSDSDSDIPIRPKLAPELDDSKEPEHLSEAEASSISHMSWSPSLSPQPPMHHDDKVLPPDSSLHEEGVSEVTTPKRVDSPASLSSSSGRQLKSVSKTVSTTRRNTTRLMKSRHRGNSISPERLFNSGYLSQEVPGNSENSDMLDPLVLHSSPPTTTKDIMIVDISSSDDDLETSIPRALKQARRIGSSSTSPLPSSDKSRQPQSGVTQQISKLQVEETPYLLGRVKSRADTKPSTLSPGRQNPSSRSKDMTSSTSIIPSTYRDAQKPYPTGHRKLSTINIHSKAVPLLSDEEAMVDQQIEEDMKAPSQRQPTSPFDPSSSHSIVVQKTSIKPFESSLTNSLERSHSPKLIPHIVNQTKAPMAKREAEDLSAERLRQPKKFKTDYGFTQEEHSPQDAATKARESRRDFMTNFSKSKSRSEISPPAKARETISTDGNTKSHRTIDRTPELHSHRFAQNNEAVTLSPQSRFWTHSNQERRIQRATSSHDSLKERNIVDEGHGMTSAKVVSKIPYIARDHWSPSQEQISREDRISMLKDVRPLSRSTFPLLQQNAQISATSRQSAKTSRIAALYSKFAETYPDYRGDEKHFIGLCRMIDNLQKGEKMEHKSLWDDFIIRHKAEYSKYIVRCSEEGDDPVPYIKFYHDQIDEPAYTKRIMEPGILKSALDQYSASPAVLQSTPSSSIPARRQSNSPTTSRSPKRSRRSLPWAQPLPSSSASSTNRTRNSLPSGDHLRKRG
ncbi:hypothetical protein AOQ84DRAFT_178276 [Glonium stellatum]|uniref:Uncharacterized protein n=1 Tax=Glonium stellatum TaxID=574774 RepID=A0A8E2JW25_9PEZI|nr:hypothetical protein AOQ84DRAFT_178276 [Glonium stellatum]